MLSMLAVDMACQQQVQSAADLKEGKASCILEIMAPPLSQQEVVVHAGQALPWHQVKVELRLLAQIQLDHHLGKEGGMLLVVASCPILLHGVAASRAQPRYNI